MSSSDVINNRKAKEQQPEERGACLLMTRRACKNSQVSTRALMHVSAVLYFYIMNSWQHGSCRPAQGFCG